MKISQHSNSDDLRENNDSSENFNLLHEKVQRWVWEQGWTELRDAQERAIGPILSGATDVIISATTASGKTEAAFLPIGSKIVEKTSGGIRTLYISPLKALINDQFERLDLFFEKLEIPVYRWHGDVSQSKKRSVLENPNGILLITPESFEALFVNHGTLIGKIFNDLSYVVIDELHSFIGTERGRQLQSLLHRLEVALDQKRIPRIALSATIGDIQIARKFLRPNNSFPCEIIESTSDSFSLKLQVRGYLISPPLIDSRSEDERCGDVFDISTHLFKTLRGSTNLIFTNSRADVETYADSLKRISDHEGIPNEFFPHHGSLSKNIREDVESMLKDKSRPTTAICTATLEMGIDIGAVSSVAQIGAPFSVTSLRQRLGRSGRRGQPAVLRIYIREDEITSDTHPEDRLRTKLVQALAIVQLLLKGWYEPPIIGRLHLSTFIQQVLSVIAQYGGMKAVQLWNILCNCGPFQQIDRSMFTEFLRGLGKEDLVSQMSDGTLILGTKGEKIVNHFDFYAAFNSPEEYQLRSGSEILGTLPINYPIFPGVYLIFAGKRWEVIDVDAIRKIVVLKSAQGGKPPSFGGGAGIIPDRVREEMYKIYENVDIPPYLNEQGKRLLEEGREYFKIFRLSSNWFLKNGDDVLIFPWKGDLVMNTLMVQLQYDGFRVTQEGVALNVSNTEPELLKEYFNELLRKNLLDPISLASIVKNKYREKYDYFLTERLLNAEYCSRNIDIDGTRKTLYKLK